MAAMRVSAKADYAIRATVELAAAGAGPLKGERIAQAQEIPIKFLENIMADLRNAGLVRSQRGAEGGYWLARPAEEITPRPRDPRGRRAARERPRRAVRGARVRGHGRAAARGVDRRAGEPAQRARVGHARRRRRAASCPPRSHASPAEPDAWLPH